MYSNFFLYFQQHRDYAVSQQKDFHFSGIKRTLRRPTAPGALPLRRSRLHAGGETASFGKDIEAADRRRLRHLFVDTEHGGFGIETARSLVSAANQAGITPFVRVCDLCYSLVARTGCRRLRISFPRIYALFIVFASAWI